MSLKVDFNLLPTPLNATIAAMEISEAIKPYSIAVAPSWSLQKVLRNFSMAMFPNLCGRKVNLPADVKSFEAKGSKILLILGAGIQRKAKDDSGIQPQSSCNYANIEWYAWCIT
jgi:hypothetical protein